MNRKTPKTSVVAFKVEEDLAEFLNGLPNKSDFIRRAIYSQLGVVCPLCQGAGSVTKEKHDHFAAFLEKWDIHQCGSCGDEFAFPKVKTGEEAPESLQELEATSGTAGAEFCVTCLAKTGSHEHD